PRGPRPIGPRAAARVDAGLRRVLGSRDMAKKRRNIGVIGVPIDLGAGRRGVDMGPSAIRIADLEKRLEELGHKVEDHGDLDVMIPETQKVGTGKLRYKKPILDACTALMGLVDKCLTDNRMPLV